MQQLPKPKKGIVKVVLAGVTPDCAILRHKTKRYTDFTWHVALGTLCCMRP